MIHKKHVVEYCKDNISLIENYEEAVNDKENVWDCHHRDEIRILPSGMVAYRTKEELIGAGHYWKCPANELIFMKQSEHQGLHNKYRHYELKGFGIKFFEHFGLVYTDNKQLYNCEHSYYVKHNNTCRWEM